jgi:4-hydroxy-tetrahydrodipicolinate reductase
MNLAIVGYGRMGRLIEALAPEYGLTVKLRLNSKNNGSFEALTKQNLTGIDLAIEFSTPQAASENIERLVRAGIPTTSGTTGWFDRLPGVRAAVEEAGGALIWGANYSVGVCIFAEIVSEAARLLATQPEYGAWAWEIHHAAKKDAPSGTLLALVLKMKESGYRRTIDMGSNRAGWQPGAHEIGFDSPGDTITLRHVSRNREGFARGALRAVCWLAGKRGVFEFREIIRELR